MGLTGQETEDDWSSPHPHAASWFSLRKLKVLRVAPGFWLLPTKIRKFPTETTWKLKHGQQVGTEYLRRR